MRGIIILALIVFSFAGLNAQNEFTDPRDGNIYRTIKIGDLTWMAENLKFTTGNDEALCFERNQHNKNLYGVLYNWKSATLACPDGWRLPSGEEFRSLLVYLENSAQADQPVSGPGAFPIQLAGMQDHEGTFTEIDESGYYWTSTEYNSHEAEYFSYMIFNGNTVIDISRKEDMPDIHGAEKENKYSVRCVKDKDGKEK